MTSASSPAPAAPVALVTGSSRGLGRAVATELAARGYDLVLTAQRNDPAVASRGRQRVVRGDLTDPGTRRQLADAAADLGRLDLLVLNAGVLGAAPLPTVADYPLDELRRAFEVNVVAQVGLVQAVLPLLTAAAQPGVLIVSSDAAVEAYPGWGGYGATKAALDQLGRVLAAELPRLRVWSVDPGDLRTDMHQAAFPGEDISDRPLPETAVAGVLQVVAGGLPSGRYRAAEFAAVSA